MIRGLLLHIVVTLAAVAAAYVAWQAPGTTRTDVTPALVDVDPEALSHVTWEDEHFGVEIRRTDAGLVVEVTPRGADTSATKSERYPGSEEVQPLWRALASLKALRRFGTLAPAELDKLGLATPSAHLTLTTGRTTRRFDIGGERFGTGDCYVHTDSGDVALVSGADLRPLRYGAGTLLDRRLVELDRRKLEKVRLVAAGRERDLVQRRADAPEAAFFADPAEPDTHLERASRWMERLLRLRVLSHDTTTPHGAPAVRLELWGRDQRVGAVALWEPTSGEARATSTAFQGSVTLSRPAVESLLRELETVMNEGHAAR